MRGLQGGILAGATALALGLAPLGAAIGADGLGDGTASVDCVPSMMESLVPAPTEREEGPSGGVSGELMESSGRTKSTTRATLKAQLKKRKRVAIIASLAIVTLLALLLLFVVIKKRRGANKKKKEKLEEEQKEKTETVARPESASANYIDDYLKNHMEKVAVGTDNLKQFLEMYHYNVNAGNAPTMGVPQGQHEPIGKSLRISLLSDRVQHGREALKAPGRKSLLYQAIYANMPVDQAMTGTDMCKTQITDGGTLWYIGNVDPKNSPQDGQWTLPAIEEKLRIIGDAVARETRSPEALAEIQSKADIGAWEAKKQTVSDEMVRPVYGTLVTETAARGDVARWAAAQNKTALGQKIDREDFRCRIYGRGGELTSQNDIPVSDLKLRVIFKKQLAESHENVGHRTLTEAWEGVQAFGKEMEEYVKTGLRLQKGYDENVQKNETASAIKRDACQEYLVWHEIHEYGSVTAVALEAEMQVAQAACDVFRRLAVQKRREAGEGKQKSTSRTAASFKRLAGGGKQAPVTSSVKLPEVLTKGSQGISDIDALASIQKGDGAAFAQEAAFQLFKKHHLKSKLAYVTNVMQDVNKHAKTTLLERYNTVFKN